MRRTIVLTSLLLIPWIAMTEEIIDEEKVREVMAEISAAGESFDLERLSHFVDSESRFLWRTSIEAGQDGKELNGEDWLEMMNFMAPLAQASAGETVSEIKSIVIDPKLNRATVVEELKSLSTAFGETWEEQATVTTVLAYRKGSIKILRSERNTTKMTKAE